MEVQSVVLKKEQYPTLKSAEKEVKALEFKLRFKNKGVDETLNTWRFRQEAPSKFNPKSYRMKEIKKGVLLVIGYKKKS